MLDQLFALVFSFNFSFIFLIFQSSHLSVGSINLSISSYADLKRAVGADYDTEDYKDKKQNHHLPEKVPLKVVYALGVRRVALLIPILYAR